MSATGSPPKPASPARISDGSDSDPMAKVDKVTTLGIADLPGEAIRHIHGGESVSPLFKV